MIRELFYTSNPFQDQFAWWTETVNDIKARLLRDMEIMPLDLVKICYEYVPAEDSVCVRTVGPQKQLNIEAFASYIKDDVYSIPVECNCCQKISRNVESRPNISRDCVRFCIGSHGKCQLCRDCIRLGKQNIQSYGYYEICGHCGKVLLAGQDKSNQCLVSVDSYHYMTQFNLTYA